MKATKMKVSGILVLACLTLASLIAIANASKTRTEFYLEAHVDIVGQMQVHIADDTTYILRYTVEGFVETREHVDVGTISMDVVTIQRVRTPATVSAQFLINLDSGETIKGIATGTETFFPDGSIDLDGKFVGHGDMHVMGEVHELPGPGAFYFDGNSW